MFFPYLTLFSALLLAAVAGVFSVAGMMALFAGKPLAGMAVGIAIELGKLMAVSWLYRYWDDRVWFRHLMVIAAIVAMLVTSIGVFGYLSKAHSDQGKDVSIDSAKISVIDDKINRLQASLTRKSESAKSAETSLRHLDEQIKVLVNHNRISDEKNGARAVSKEQKPERDRLTKEINNAEKEIDVLQGKISELQEEKFLLGNTVRNYEVEVGPVKSLASIIYDDPEHSMDKAIKIVIFLIMIALDPMAIMLLMGYNHIMIKTSNNYSPPENNKSVEDFDDKEENVDLLSEPPKTDAPSDNTKKTSKSKEIPARVNTQNPHRTDKRIQDLKNKIYNPDKNTWINTITKRK